MMILGRNLILCLPYLLIRVTFNVEYQKLLPVTEISLFAKTFIRYLAETLVMISRSEVLEMYKNNFWIVMNLQYLFIVLV